jgi:Tol biopolymer transport system component
VAIVALAVGGVLLGGGSGGSGGSSGLGDNEAVVTVQSGAGTSLAVVDLDSGESTPVDVAAQAPSRSTISQDRESIVYLADDPNSNNQRIPHEVRPDGRDDHVLFDEAECPHATKPTWNAAGDQIAVICTTEDGKATLWLAETDGTLTQPLDQITQQLAGSPTWAEHDGTSVIVYMQQDGGATNLYWVDPDSDAAPTPVTTNTQGIDYNPTWSDDGGLLYLRTEDARLGESGTPMLLADLDAEPQQLPFGDVRSLTWAPSGGELAYIASDGALVVSTPDGGGQRRVEVDIPEGTVGDVTWDSR